jgi:pyruvate dehydrogenase phosphatase
VLLKQQVWRVKGLIQVSRSIGDFYLKKPEYNREPLTARFRLPEPLKRPVMSADPECAVYTLGPRDEFIVFASDGLWEHLSNQEAVNIICSQPRQGIARRLIKAAMQEAARKREMRYTDLKGIERGIRRHFHDDITVIVLFLDPTNNSHHRKLPSQHISVKCPVDTPQNSKS